ncbi:MAG: hypothetical protein A4E60_03115 [Syntrophorhabdus sp. PtaB.Bin047]|nr:MAG: hypothetical protein A4E60_03115 [Syntrophorhabdus sp. PtaB.Bin047]OPY76640.1 MAG: hypothetical protein A4E63_00027 [Syntrophorhabdus sp. PtaU1.Bin050]
MKIAFTKKQFETLLKAVYLGTRTVNAYEDDLEGNEYVELQNYVFGFAKDFGLEKYVDYDKAQKAVWPSADLEEDEALNEFIDRYDDFTFLDKLIYNLAGRDMLDKHGPKALEKMSDEEFFKEEESFAEKYRKEFAKNGIKNLTVSKGK